MSTVTSKNIKQGDCLELRDNRYGYDLFVGRILILAAQDNYIVSLTTKGKVTYTSRYEASIELFTKLND